MSLDKVLSQDLRECDNKSLSWSVLKLVLGVVAVGSVYMLESRLNSMGCRFAVNNGLSVGAGFLTVGKNVLNHRYTGYLLDIFYLVVIGFLLFSSVAGFNDLENGGCELYYRENTDVELQPTTQFMNETEYKNWQKNRKFDENLERQPLNSGF